MDDREVSNKSKKVSAIPSASNQLLFYMDDDDQEEEEDFVANQVANSQRGSNMLSELQGEEENLLARERELTDKFLAGKLNFKEFVSEFTHGDDEEDSSGNDDSELDEDWEPPGRSKRPNKNRGSQKSVQKTVSEAQEAQGNMELFEEELADNQNQKKKMKIGRRKRLDPALQGLIGEANLRFARGDLENAEKMCLEVIRQDPTVPEPFQTLATLYEEEEEMEKSLQFALLAAHLAPPDGEEWARLADMSLEQNDLQQACICYRKAIDADPSNAKYYFTRCELLKRLGDKRAALRGYKRLMTALGDNDGESYLRAAKEAAMILHERRQLEEAKQHLSSAFEKHPSVVLPEDVNLFLELLLELECYQEALMVCCTHCQVHFTSDKDTEDLAGLDPLSQLGSFTEMLVPDDLIADIRCKLTVALINLKAAHLVKDELETFLEADPDDFGDFILDIAEALKNNRDNEMAIRFLEKLVGSLNFGEAVVWLQYAECLQELKRLEDAEEAYKKVVELAPNHYEARLQLSMIMRKLGRPEDALLALDQNETEEMLNPHLMFERCNLLLEEKKYDEFIMKSRLFFSRHFVNIRNKDELHAISSAKKISSKNKALSELRTFRREPLQETDKPEFQTTPEKNLTPDQEFQLFRKLCEVLFDLKRMDELQRMTFSALGSPLFAKSPDIHKECEFLCLLSSFFNGDSFHAYNFVRELVIKQVNNSAVWNLFNLVIMRADDVRHNRFLMRLMSKHNDNVALGILNGHNCLVAGTYKYSLGEYMSAFKQDSNNPLVALMLGLTFCHMACQKFSAKKHSLVVQACSFLNTYRELRGECQEVYYNLGRAMHQLNLLPAALFYYKKALILGPSVVSPEGQQENDHVFDLKREIAYNVSIIYENSGNEDLARSYVEKYIVI